MRPADEHRWKEISNKLIAEMRGIGATLLGIQKQIETVAKERHAKNEHENTEPILRAELQIPEPIKGDWESDSTKRGYREWIAIGVSILTLFAVVAYAIINYHMLCEMRTANKAASDSFAQTLRQMEAQTAAQQRAADAAKSAAKTAGDTLVSSQRPWVGISADRPITVDRVQIVLKSVPPYNLQKALAIQTEVSFTLENFGNSPAIKIAPFTFEGIPTDEAKVPEIWSKIGCTHGEQKSKGESGPTITLMPKSFISRRTTAMVQTPKGIIIHHIWLLGCIVYQDTLSGPIRHTRVVLHSNYTPGMTESQFGLWESDAD